MESEILKQGRSIRRTQQAFVMFAVGALVLGLLSLIAVSTKLGTRDIHVTAVGAAARPPGPPPRRRRCRTS